MINLGIVSSGGEFKPYAKYNAKADKWFVKQDGKEESEVSRPTFIANFDEMKTGWFLMLAGQAPDKKFDEELGKIGARPSDTHKRGFEIDLFSKSNFGGVVTFNATSKYVCEVFTELYSEYYTNKDANKGKLPVVECTGSTPQKSDYGTNYKPTLKITKWVDKPVEFATGSVQETVTEEESEF